jgi:hypothetical protein
MNKHDENQLTAKQTRRRDRRRTSDEKNTALTVSHENNHNDDIVSKTKIIDTSKNSLHHHSDSDNGSEDILVVPETSGSIKPNGLLPDQNTNNPNSPSLTFALRALYEMVIEDLDRFVYTPVPNGLGDIQCRITRNKRGMDKGFFPTFYMHIERPGDGRKVRYFNDK